MLAILGLIIVLMVLIIFFFTKNPYMLRVEEKIDKVIDLKDGSSLEIKVERGTVKLVPTADGVGRLLVDVYENAEFNWLRSNGTLKLESQLKNTENVVRFAGGVSLTVMVPAINLKSISVSVSDGMIEIEGVKADDINIDGIKVPIKVNKVAASHLKITTSMGNVKVRASTFGEFAVYSNSGNILVSEVEGEVLRINAAHGVAKIELSSVSDNAVIDILEGKITLVAMSGSGELKVRMNNGIVEVMNCKISSCEVSAPSKSLDFSEDPDGIKLDVNVTEGRVRIG